MSKLFVEIVDIFFNIEIQERNRKIKFWHVVEGFLGCDQESWLHSRLYWSKCYPVLWPQLLKRQGRPLPTKATMLLLECLENNLYIVTTVFLLTIEMAGYGWLLHAMKIIFAKLSSEGDVPGHVFTMPSIHVLSITKSLQGLYWLSIFVALCTLKWQHHIRKGWITMNILNNYF